MTSFVCSVSDDFMPRPWQEGQVLPLPEDKYLDWTKSILFVTKSRDLIGLLPDNTCIVRTAVRSLLVHNSYRVRKFLALPGNSSELTLDPMKSELLKRYVISPRFDATIQQWEYPFSDAVLDAWCRQAVFHRRVMDAYRICPACGKPPLIRQTCEVCSGWIIHRRLQKSWLWKQWKHYCGGCDGNRNIYVSCRCPGCNISFQLDEAKLAEVYVYYVYAGNS